MKYISLVFFLCFTVLSCKKDKTKISYTSDAPDNFTTGIGVGYNQNTDTTSISVYFTAVVECCEPKITKSVVLPDNSYLKYNGIELGGDYRNLLSVQGNHDALIEFLNFDQILYVNYYTVPDTVYFENLPDTINADQDLLLEFGGAPLAENEYWMVSFAGSNYSVNDSYFYQNTTDSTMLVEKINFEPNKSYEIELTRFMDVENPSLPGGGGGIRYRYEIAKTIYCE